MVGDAADMDFEFSTEVVTLWPWQYHHYEPPGCANHTDLYYCNPNNRCESCRAQAPRAETNENGTAAQTLTQAKDELFLEASTSNMCSQLVDNKCRVYSTKSCFICSAVTDQLVSIIRWVHEGDLLGSTPPQLAGEVEDAKYLPMSSCSSKPVSQSVSNASCNSYSSEPERGDNSILSESRSQPWGNGLSESASISSGFEMETDMEAYDSGSTRPIELEKYTKSASGQCSWYPAAPKSNALSSASAHTGLSLGVQNNVQQYSTCESEIQTIDQFVNPLMSDHYFPPNRQAYIPVTSYVPVPWHQFTVPHGAPRSFVNYPAENKPVNAHMGHNDWSSFRGPYCSNLHQGGTLQSEDSMNELTYLFNKDCNITNRKSSSAPAGSPALLSPRGYFQWESHEFPPPCPTVSLNTQSNSTDRIPQPVSSSFGNNANPNPETSTNTPILAFSSVVKSKPEQCRSSGSSTMSQPVRDITHKKLEPRRQKSTKSSARSSKNSNSSSNVSPTCTRPAKQVSSKANEMELCAENISPLVKQRPFLLRATHPMKRDIHEPSVAGQPLHMKFSFQPKVITVSPVIKEEIENSHLTSNTTEVAPMEDLNPPEIETSTVSSKSDIVAKSNIKKDKSKNGEGNKGTKKGKIKKAKGKKNCPIEKAKEPVEANVSKSTDHQEKNILNPISSTSKRKHMGLNSSTPSRVFPFKLRELNPDVRTPRSVRLRALNACRMNLNSTAGNGNSDSENSSNSTLELSFDESSLSFDEGVELSESKNKLKNKDGEGSHLPIESRRVKKKKKKGSSEAIDNTEETRDMGCQTSK